MWRILLLSVFQSLLLAGGQVLLKFALANMKPFGMNRDFWGSLFLNWQFAACGLMFGLASLLWMYMMKLFPLSVVYPLLSLSYVFGMIAALLFFHETVSVTRWIGVLLIVLGCVLIAK